MAAEPIPQAEVPNLHQRLLEVQRAVTQLTKDGQSEGKGSFAYVSSSAVLGAVREAMDAHGLLLTTSATDYTLHLNAAYGGKQHLTELMMELVWVNVDNPEERETYRFPGQGIDSGEKGVGKAATYAEKYFLLKFFHIATDGDDPDAGSGGNGNGRPQAPRRQAPRQQPQQQAPQQAPPPAQTKPPQRMDNIPEGAPKNIDELRDWMAANGYPRNQHAGVLQGMAGDHTLDIDALPPPFCLTAWKRLEETRQAASQEAPESEPPAPEPEPERMDNPPPENVPQTPGDLAMYLSNQGVAPEQHDDVVNALTRLTVPNAKRRKIGKLDAAMCAEIWRRHQDSDTTMDDQAEPAPEPAPTVSEFVVPEWTAEDPPSVTQLSQWFGKLGLSKGQLADVRKKAKIEPGKRVALFDGSDCWAWYCAFVAMASRDEGGELRLNIQAEVAA